MTWTTLESQIQRLNDQIVLLNQSITTTRIQPILDALVDWGAIETPLTSTPTLTSFGILATEANEGNPLLMAKLYESQVLKDATATEIVGTLAAFIVDRESETKTVHPTALSPAITQNVKYILCQIDIWGCNGVRIDEKYGIQSPPGFWNLTTLWVEIATAWMNGTEASELSKTYDIYEGNLMRGLHKVASITNEWISMLTYKADVDMLNTLKDVQTTLLRDIAQPESLYLRL